MTGTATVTRPEQIFLQARAGDPVFESDIIETTADGLVCIRFIDGTTFNLSNNARMALKEFPGSETARPALLDVARGDFAFIAGEMAKAGRLEIDTPVARIRGSTRVGGIGTLSLISLFFAAMEEVQAAPPDAARTEDEIIPVDYSSEPHGSFELTTKESVPRRIYVDDPGVTWALRLNSSSELSISSVANSPAQMAQLSAIQQGVLHTYSVGLQSMQGPTFNGQNGSTTNPNFEILPGNARPINFSSQPDAGGLQQNLNGSQQHSITDSKSSGSSGNSSSILGSDSNILDNNSTTVPALFVPPPPPPPQPLPPPPSAPTITTAAPAQNHASSIDIGGTAAANSTVTLFNGASAVGTTSADGSGSWQINNIVLADGSDYNFTAMATDSAGHISGASNTLVIHDDQTAPSAPLIVTTAPSQNTAPSIDIAGSAEANSTVTLLNGASQIGMTTADGSGNWHVNGIALVNGAQYSFTATATDAAGNSSGPSNPLTFDEVQNHAPVNTVPASALTVNEDVPLGFAGAISVHDVDGNLASTQLSVLSGALTVSLASGATISSGANASGTLTLSGSETQINAALATLTYQGGPNFNGDDTLTVLSTDSGALTDSDTVQIHITPVNDAPVTSPVTLTAIAEDSGPRLITQAELLANASDVDGPALTALNLAISSGKGQLVSNPGGTWTYNPAANDDTSVTFSYAVTDGVAAPVATTASLDITPVNDAPVTSPVTLTAIAEDSGPRLITQAELLANASDVDGPALTALNLAISSGKGQLVSNPGGTWTYNPAANDDTSVTFSYAVSDGVAAPVATTASLDITPVNDAPVVANAIADQGATQGSPFTFQFAGNTFNDVDTGDTLNYAATLSNGSPLPSWLGFDAATRTFSGTPANGDVGSIAVKVTATDGGNASVSDIFNITVGNTNDAPVNTVPASALTVNEDVPLGFAGAISVHDVDGNLASTQLSVLSGALTVSLASGATISSGANASGTLTLSGSETQINAALATLTYQGGPNFNGDDTLTVLSTDSGALTDSDTVQIHITPVNDAPVTSPVTLTAIAEDSGPRLITQAELLANASDVDGPALTALNLAISSGKGQLVSNPGGTWTYNPAANDDTSVTFSYAVSDGVAAPVATTASLDITPVNDAPAASITPVSYSATEQVALSLKNTGLLISDADAGSGSVTVTLSVGEGTLTVGAGTSGALVSNNNSSSVTISGTVAQINALLNTNATSTVSYIDNSDAPASSTTLSLSVNDNGNTGSGGALASNIATATINIAPVNDAPSGTDKTVSTLEDTAYTFTTADFGFSDATDNPAANALQAVKITTLPGAGTLTDNGNAVSSGTSVSVADITGGLLKLTPASNANGNGYASFTFQVQDNGGTANGGVDLDPSPNTITVNVTPVNDAPVAANTHGPYSATEQVALSLKNNGLSISDADAGSGSVTVTLSVGEGTLTVGAGGSGALVSNSGTSSVTISGTVAQINALLNTNATSTVSYIDNSDAPASSTTLSLSVNDNGNTGSGGALASNIATATINIAPVNDAPVLNSAATPVLAAENEDAGAPVGAVGTLVSSLVDLNPPAGGLDNVTDADSGAVTGIALTATSTTNGSWWYSLDNGAHWTDVNAVSAVSNTNALLLAADADTRIYFQPNANFSGSISSAITFRAWDQSSGAAGTKASTATNGGATAFSAVTDTASITVNTVDHAPVIQAPDILTRVTVPGAVLAGAVPGTDSLASHAIAPDMNGEGRYVVFFSTENIPTQGDNNDLLAGDVFLYDRLSGATTTLTDAQHIPLGLRETGERFSGFAISGDGNFVVFTGTYTVNGQFGPQDINKVYLYDRNADKVTLLTDSVTHATITAESNAQINGNGALIALVRNATDGQHVSVYKSDGTLIKDVTAANSVIPDNLDHFQQAAISNDGNYVSFWAYAQDANFNPTGIATLYVLDRQSNSITAVGTTTAEHDLWMGSLSRDGNRIVFQSDQNLDANANDSGGNIDIFVYDRTLNTTQRVSGGLGSALANGDSIRPSISPDGNFITFASNASNLVPGDTNGQPDTFVKNLQTGVIERVSVAVDGTQGDGDSSLASAVSGGGTGTFIAFGSAASTLVPGDTNGAADIFVLDRSGGTAGQVVEDASVSPAGTLSTHGAFAFSDIDLTDVHTVSITNVAVSGAPAGFILPPGGLGIFTPTITENTGDADPSGQLSWTFTVDNAALATLNFGDHIQQVYTVQINDGHGGVTSQDVTLTLVGATDQPTLTIQMLAPSTVFNPGDDPIVQMGSGTVQPGGTPTHFTIVNAGANRQFIFDGYGFTYDGASHPTGGVITAIHDLNNAATPLVDFTGVGVGAQAWYAAVVEAAQNPNGPHPLLDALTGTWAFNLIGGSTPVSFVGSSQNDTLTGGSGDDFLLGDAGSDTLTGGGGNDTLGGGIGNDILRGGDGQDLAIYFHPTEGEADALGPINVQLAAGVVTSSDGTDMLRSIERVTGTNFADTFDATGFGSTSLNAGSIGVGGSFDGTLNEFEGLGGNDQITGNTNTRVSYLQAAAGVTVTFTAPGVGSAHGTDPGDVAGIGTDTFVSGVNRVRGSNFNDSFTGSNNPAGTNELFEGRGGDDFIDGGGGFDTAVYGNENALINVQLAAGMVAGGPNTGHDTLRSVEGISGTEFADTFDATGFTATPTIPLPNAGSAGADGLGEAFNRFEGRGGGDFITGNNNTQIAFDNAADGVTVTFTGTKAGNSHGTDPGDVADVGTDTFTGVNSVRGSTFDDVIIASDPGNDNFDGRGGVDRAIYSGATGPISVNMQAGTVSGAGIGNDTLVSVESIQGSAFGDTYVSTNYAGASAVGSIPATFNEFEGMGGNDSFTGTPGGSSGATVSYVHALAAVTVDLNLVTVAGSTGIAHGTAPGDLAGIGTDTFFGGVQVVRGSDFDDTLLGSNNFNGPEVFEGRGGNDNIDGRAGFDRVFYEFRLDDNVTGGVVVNLAAGTVDGDASIGHDTLHSIEAVRGTSFDDVFNAAGFTASSPNAGSAGTDTAGNALNEFEGLGGDDTIIGNGDTRMSFVNATAGVTVDLAFGTATGDDSVGSDTISGVNSIIGSSFADTLYGSTNAGNTSEVFDGGAGNDILVGRGGFDQAVYNADLGTVSGITINMAAGTVIGDASIGTDTLNSIESIRGTNFADVYVAANFNGASDDLPLATTFNEFEGMGGNDNITGNGDTRISYTSASAAVTVDMVAGTAHGTAAGDVANVGSDTFTGVNRVIGSNFNDTITGDGNDNVIEGGAGNDTLDGGGGNDTASYQHAAGGVGNVGVTVSLMISGPQNTGQAGTDTLTGFENLRGSSFNDTLTGNGLSRLEGGPGADHLIGQPGQSDVASYEHAAAGVTVNLANPAANTGEAAGDTFTSINNVRGSNFDDTITGDGNNNVFRGLGGNDTFVFKPAFGHDTIVDFQPGQDAIDIDHSLFFTLQDILDHAAPSGADTVITDTAGDTITLQNVAPANLHQSDFHLV